MSLKGNYLTLQQEIAEAAKMAGRDPAGITLVAVSKGESVESILELYSLGCRHFGESRIQEAKKKIPLCPPDCIWHLIGSLQSNKARLAVQLFSCIHSIDSSDLAVKLSSLAVSLNRPVAVFLQVNILKEASKHGMTREECKAMFPQLLHLPGIEWKGLMGMVPLNADRNLTRYCFSQLKLLQEELNADCNCSLQDLSIGMSQDYLLAINEGSTFLRIGSRIFKEIR